jgi:hypothetical protein
MLLKKDSAHHLYEPLFTQLSFLNKNSLTCRRN